MSYGLGSSTGRRGPGWMTSRRQRSNYYHWKPNMDNSTYLKLFGLEKHTTKTHSQHFPNMSFLRPSAIFQRCAKGPCQAHMLGGGWHSCSEEGGTGNTGLWDVLCTPWVTGRSLLASTHMYALACASACIHPKQNTTNKRQQQKPMGKLPNPKQVRIGATI